MINYLLESHQDCEVEFFQKDNGTKIVINKKNSLTTETEEVIKKKVAILETLIHNHQLFRLAKNPSDNAIEEVMAKIYQERSQQIDFLLAQLEEGL